MGASKNRYSTSKWMVKIRENPIKMDDLGGKPTIFGNHHISPLEKYRLKMVHFPYFPLYWLFNRDPYSHLLSIHCRMSSPIYIYPKQPGSLFSLLTWFSHHNLWSINDTNHTNHLLYPSQKIQIFTPHSDRPWDKWQRMSLLGCTPMVYSLVIYPA